MTTFAPAAPAYRRVTGTPTWRAISRRHRVRLVETLEWISDRLRQKGEHGGPATHATIRVFRALLFRFANTATGGVVQIRVTPKTRIPFTIKGNRSHPLSSGGGLGGDAGQG
jgi:hypothetical protein